MVGVRDSGDLTVSLLLLSQGAAADVPLKMIKGGGRMRNSGWSLEQSPAIRLSRSLRYYVQRERECIEISKYNNDQRTKW